MHIQYDAENRLWALRWQDSLLQLRLTSESLICDYFGSADRAVPPNTSRPFPDTILVTRSEASVQLTPDDRQVCWSEGDWSQPDAATFVLTLRAVDLPLAAALRYHVDETTGVLLRQTTLRHLGDGPAIPIRRAGSVAALLPPEIRDVIHLAGCWGAETQVQQLTLPRTPLLLESRAGKTGFDYAPYVALVAPGETYLCELLWSGNWQLHVRRLPDGRVSLAGGLNDWGLCHNLQPGEELALPSALLLHVVGDLNAATQRLHDYRRRVMRPNPDRPVPVQFNSWYPYPGEPPVEKMKSLASAAGELGCEVFVLDAGWYTTETEDPNENWWARTGDWVVNPRLFPNGLEELSSHCQQCSLGFGIWFEPEAVSPSALIRRSHPEWLHVIGGRPTPADRRGILNLGVPEARAFARERILRVLRSTGATWMKWDFNTDLLQGGWAPGLPPELTHQDPLIAHYRGLYQLQDELRAALPSLTLEMCAGGGGRFDPAILSHAHTNWMSDQTQPLMNLAIHFGSQLAHAAIECNDWLIEWPPHDGLRGRQHVDHRGDLAFRTRVAMLGSFGVSAPVERWTAEDMAIVRQHVVWYKEAVRPIIHTGDQYMLTPAPPLDGEGDWAAIWYAAKDARRGVLFAFRLASADAQRSFALPGLDPDTHYRLRTPEGRSAVRTGAELASGLVVTAAECFRSALIVVEQSEAGEPCGDNL